MLVMNGEAGVCAVCWEPRVLDSGVLAMNGEAVACAVCWEPRVVDSGVLVMTLPVPRGW